MPLARDDFDKRVLEIETYFGLVSLLDKDNPVLHYQDNGVDKEHHTSPDLIRILKANGFLLLYNLVESCTKNCIRQIFNAIKNDGLSYTDLAEKLREIWADQRMRQHQGAKDNNLRKHIREVAEAVTNQELVELDEKNIRISGNIDAREIRGFAKAYGFESGVVDPARGNCLATIKNQRNTLAHGDLTFVECGRDFTVEDMVQFKENVKGYLQDVITNVDTFVTNRKYAKAAAAAATP